MNRLIGKAESSAAGIQILNVTTMYVKYWLSMVDQYSLVGFGTMQLSMVGQVRVTRIKTCCSFPFEASVAELHARPQRKSMDYEADQDVLGVLGDGKEENEAD